MNGPNAGPPQASLPRSFDSSRRKRQHKEPVGTNLEAGKDKFLLWKAEVDKVIPAPNREIMARLLKEIQTMILPLFLLAGTTLLSQRQRADRGAGSKDFGVDDNKAVFSYQSGYNRHYAYRHF